MLFSDLSGYTALTEKLDPEEVKEITDRVFAEISRVVSRYDGFIGRFEGDGAMVLFGVPRAHEDDALRAVRAAKEIHGFVEGLTPEYREKTGRSLSMHTGIASGLVVSQVEVDRGVSDFTGDTVNLASRLCGLASAGSILVDPQTYELTAGHYTFSDCGLLSVKGKEAVVHAYEVLAPRLKPSKIRRPRGARVELIGRKMELVQLLDAAEVVERGYRVVVSVCGDPGTGKTRLVEEFRMILSGRRFQWLAGHAYSYTQTIPYWPLVDLFNGTWQIGEEDPPDVVRRKIETGVGSLLGGGRHAVEVIGSLYSLTGSGPLQVSPELWKAELFGAAGELLSALAKRQPTVICLEDIHWADPPFLEWLRHLMTEFPIPALFLCIYRTPFELFTGQQQQALGRVYREIRLQDLSPSETQEMMESLLNSSEIPLELRRFVHEKVEGNPFYLEELIHSLIESETLAETDGSWRLTRPLVETVISPTIQGVIAARLDRLAWETRRVLQEASVIGRHFLYSILERITEIAESLRECLNRLEALDLVRTKSLQPELEYIFKHALTQEVAYSGLLKKDRRRVHERIGEVMESLFHDRLPEIYETLAYHYKQSNAVEKAAEYLVKSGEKALRRYALEESHRHFKEACDLLTDHGLGCDTGRERLMDVVIKWSFVYYYRGDYRGLLEHLNGHRRLAESLTDKSLLGMFHAWLSCAMWHREKVREAYEHLLLAVRFGEESGSSQVLAYACTWLIWVCVELGRFQEALEFARRAQSLCRLPDCDHYVYFNSLAGLAYVHVHCGERREALEVCRSLVDFGRNHSNIRSIVMGQCLRGFGHLVGGDIAAASASLEEAIRSSADPWYTQFPRLALCYAKVAHGEYDGIRETLEQIIAFSEERGAEYVGSPAKVLLGAVLAAQGHLAKGMAMIRSVAEKWHAEGNLTRHTQARLIMGRIYALMAQGGGKKNLSTLLRNAWFLIRNAPFADRKARLHLDGVIETASRIGARDFQGRASLTLGLLHKAKGRKGEARAALENAVRIFEQCEAEVYLQHAREALEALQG